MVVTHLDPRGKALEFVSVVRPEHASEPGLVGLRAGCGVDIRLGGTSSLLSVSWKKYIYKCMRRIGVPP